MKNPFKSILRHHLTPFSVFPYLTPILIGLTLISCSQGLFFKREVPKPINYSRIEFKYCDSPENQSYLCITREDAEISVLDLKKCQAQNDLLRELLNGN
jgi:hypothetical protein